MTREEAIEWLIQIKDKYIHDGDEQFDAKRKEALNMAIDALERTDTHECVDPTHACDLIKRQDAIDKVEEWIETYNSGRGGKRERDAIKRVISGIKKLPSAQPETCEGCKHLGKWENEVEYGYPSPCTSCKRRVEDHYER